MVFSSPNMELVDLMTTDSALEDLILKEYRGSIFEEQHEVKELKNGVKLYVFYNLDRPRLMEVLENYEDGLDYWVWESIDCGEADEK